MRLAHQLARVAHVPSVGLVDRLVDDDEGAIAELAFGRCELAGGHGFTLGLSLAVVAALYKGFDTGLDKGSASARTWNAAISTARSWSNFRLRWRLAIRYRCWRPPPPRARLPSRRTCRARSHLLAFSKNSVGLGSLFITLMWLNNSRLRSEPSISWNKIRRSWLMSSASVNVT